MEERPWVLISGGFHRNGGMDKANLALAEYLVSSGKVIHVVTHSADQSLHNNPLVRLHVIPRPLESFLLGAPLLNIEGRRVAKRVTSQFAGATVVVNGSNCSWPDINWAHYVHHAWPGTFEGQPYLIKKARTAISNLERSRERSSYRKARVVIANSNTTRRDLLKYFSLNPDQVKTVYLGCDPDCVPIETRERFDARASLNIADSQKVALFLGSLGADNRKGVDILLSAWKLMQENNAVNVNLFVAGNGSASTGLQADIAKCGLQDRIRLVGFRENVRELLAASDVLISPARYEPYGLNVQEAICCGIPAIVSAAAGVAERYPSSLKPFLIPDPENVPDLVNRLNGWQQNAEHWATEFQSFGERLRANTWQDMARDFVSVAAIRERTATPLSAS